MTKRERGRERGGEGMEEQHGPSCKTTETAIPEHFFSFGPKGIRKGCNFIFTAGATTLGITTLSRNTLSAGNTNRRGKAQDS
jgi:hypothetical protein